MKLIRETQRLIVRPATEADYEIFVKGYELCLPSKNRFDEGRFDTGFMTEKWYVKWLNDRSEEAKNDVDYTLNIFRKEDGASVGYCDIMPIQRGNFQCGRIGYTIHNNCWGQGYGTEAAMALKEIAFRDINLHRIEAHINLDNAASKRIAEKAGFTFECVRKGFMLEDGIWTDNEIYVAYNDQWTEIETV